jgi:Ca-activated chloride channel family protein
MNKSSEVEGILFQKNGKPVPLAGVEVQGDIIGRGAKVNISQRFRNTEKKPIEAVYKFPLPENATVCGFRALIDGRIVEGKIEEKEKAFELYDKALADGHKAQLMDEERPNIFTLSVGNIKPDSTVVIEITYITLLDSHKSEVRFFLPTTISPRYTPASQKDDNGIPVSDIVNPPYALHVPYGLTININVHDRKAISSIESPSHTIKTIFKGDDATINFSADKAAMDRDFVLTIAYEKDFTNRAFVTKDNDETFIQVDLTPDELTETGKTDLSSQGREIVFVLDCSGSMQGESIESAKKALEIMIRALNPNTMFNVYRFGATFQNLYPQSKSYDENSMQEALKYLSQADASLGGTEVLATLTDIYQKELESGYRRDVILITDGEISNEDEVMKLVKHHAETTKLSAVGIGSGPNEYLIKGVARAAGGATEFIAPNERIEPKALRLFQKVMSGSISSLKVYCGVEIDQAPISPSAYINQPTSFFAKLKDDKAQNKSVKVTGRSDGGLREWIIDLDEVSNKDLPISKLWAREKIREFEEGEGLLPGSQQKHRSEDKNNKAIIDISRKYGIISKSTSFVGIEKKSNTEDATSDMALRVVPTLVTDGWHVAQSQVHYSIASAPLYMRKSQPQFKKILAHNVDMVSESLPEDFEIPSFLRRKTSEPLISFSKASRGVLKVLSNITGNDPLLDILSLQRAGGGFDADVLIGDLLRISLSDLQAITDKIDMKNHPDRMVILATAIVLTILELKYGERRDEWNGVVSKSRNWLQNEVAKVQPTMDQKPLEDWVKNFVKERLGIKS